MAGQVALRGHMVLLTTRSEKGSDVVIGDNETGKTAFVQVKTNGVGKTTSFWVLGKRDLGRHAPNVFYALVNLKKDENHEYYVVPASEVSSRGFSSKARTGSEWHQIYRKEILAFRDRWDLLASALE